MTALQNGKENIAGLISLAGAVTPADSLIVEQIRQQFIVLANSTFCANLVGDASHEIFESVRNETADPNVALEINVPFCNFTFNYGFPTFWKDWIDLGENIFENYEALDLPNLIIQGEEDFNVPPANALRFEQRLNPQKTQVHILENINHFLTPQDSPNVAPEILNIMVDWIKNVKGVSSTSNSQSNDFKIFQNGNQIVIEHSTLFDQIQITDLSGRLLLKSKISSAINHKFTYSSKSKFAVISLFKNGKLIASKKHVF